MRLPQFLIIGAMKSGTTTLYRDLQAHPRVFMPHDKEPHALCDDAVRSVEGLAKYAGLFEAAGVDQLCGEASTGYTKLPRYAGVAERALEVLGPGLRVIYIMRHPVDRVISHHHHLHYEGKAGADINQAVHEIGELVEVSRYAMQVRPWIEAFGRDRVALVRFEDAMSDRQGNARRLWSFLGLEAGPELVADEKQANTSAGKPYFPAKAKWLMLSGVYRNLFRPMLPVQLRRWVIDHCLPRAKKQLAAPTPQTLRWLAEALGDDAQEMGVLMGLPGPAWDLDRALSQSSSPLIYAQSMKEAG